MAEVLAWPSCRPEISLRDGFRSERLDVVMKRYLWPVSFENCLAMGINFTVEGGLQSRVLEAKIKATNARKEGCKPQFVVIAHRQSPSYSFLKNPTCAYPCQQPKRPLSNGKGKIEQRFPYQTCRCSKHVCRTQAKVA